MQIVNVSEPIVRHYLTLVEAKKKDITEVPEKFRQEIADILGISLEEITLEQAKEQKIAALSEECNAIIENGTDVELSTGTEHFTFTLYDQSNIDSLFNTAVYSKMDGIPYHSSNGSCKLYSNLDIARIYCAKESHKLYHITYFNALRDMIQQTYTEIDKVQAFSYGDELTGEYLEKLMNIMEQGTQLLNASLTAVGINPEELAVAQ